MTEEFNMNNNLEDIINSCPFTTEFSKFEQDSFLAPSSAGYPRYMIDLINRYRKIQSDLESETRTFERNVLVEEKQKIEKILSEQDSTRLKNAVANWETVESEYWVDTLGKLAAIEILTYGKPTYETMMKMAKLPEEFYIKATQICVKLANAIKETTVKAETDVGVITEESPISTFSTDLTPVPNKLILKKIK